MPCTSVRWRCAATPTTRRDRWALRSLTSGLTGCGAARRETWCCKTGLRLLQSADDLARTHPRTPSHRPATADRSLRSGRGQARCSARRDRRTPHRRCRPVLPDHPPRGLEPGRGHRQERQLLDRPRRWRAGGGRREDRFCLLRRHLRGRAARRRAHGSQHRRGGPEPARQDRAQAQDRDQPLALPAHRPDRHARQHPEGRAAREDRKNGPRPRPPRRAGDGRCGRRVRRRDGRSRRRHPCSRCAAAGAAVDHRDR